MLAVSAPRLPPAVLAFDALAARFDERFSSWKSVSAQRRAVRRRLLRAFPEGSRLLELGGGTGEDALFLAERGRHVFLTDGSPEMAARASAKAQAAGLEDRVTVRRLAIEELDLLVEEREKEGAAPFEGCYSNFAALNCVADLASVARAMARLLSPSARALLVLFGPFCPGEMLVLSARGEWRSVFRRMGGGPAPARVAGHEFEVFYPSPGRIARAFAPGFVKRSVRGVGIFVPPSSAEPLISSWPRVLACLEALDRVFERPLARLGDHVLLEFARTS